MFPSRNQRKNVFMFNLAGYEVDHKLYESASSITYRAMLNGQHVILKTLKELYPEPKRIAWFRREYEVTRKLQLSGVAAAYALENNQHRWVMVLEDFGGESLARLGGLPSASGQLVIADFLRFPEKLRCWEFRKKPLPRLPRGFPNTTR